MKAIRAISLWQPWASAMALGIKRAETRGRACSHRGPLGIHAAQQRGPEVRAAWNRLTAEREIYAAFCAAGLVKFDDLPFGKLLAVVDLYDCQTTEARMRSADMSEAEYFLGNYGPDRFAWMTRNVRPLKSPLAVCGRQGFFFVNVPGRFLPEVPA